MADPRGAQSAATRGDCRSYSRVVAWGAEGLQGEGGGGRVYAERTRQRVALKMVPLSNVFCRRCSPFCPDRASSCPPRCRCEDGSRTAGQDVAMKGPTNQPSEEPTDPLGASSSQIPSFICFFSSVSGFSPFFTLDPGDFLTFALPGSSSSSTSSERSRRAAAILGVRLWLAAER